MAERDLELALLRLAWRIDALDEWRKDVDLDRARLKDLVKADEIAEAVAKKVNHERTLQLTLVQKAVAFLVGAVAVAGGIKGLLG